MRVTLQFTAAVGVAASLVLCLGATPVWTATGEEVQARVSADLAVGRPIVVHVVVALCDNENQGIVPVPAQLGNGQDPKTNLYWGALYGLRTHLTRSAGWRKLGAPKVADERILERAVLYTTIRRSGSEVPVYLVADAWDGSHIKAAIERFLAQAAGGHHETIQVGSDTGTVEVRAGGSSHLVAYAGHNGLMEFSVESPTDRDSTETPCSSLVLACISKDYFVEHLQAAQSHALLMTTGLMAPEAYTLDAAIRAWVSGGTSAGVVEAAAVAYDQYQKCGIGAARNLFWGSP